MREKKDINVEVGRRVRQAREAAGLTQERFAELIGISPQNVSCVERGLAGVSLTVLRRMCEILHVSSDALLWGRSAGNDAEVLARRLEQLPPEQFRVVQNVINSVLELTVLPEEKKDRNHDYRIMIPVFFGVQACTLGITAKSPAAQRRDGGTPLPPVPSGSAGPPHSPARAGLPGEKSP